MLLHYDEDTGDLAVADFSDTVFSGTLFGYFTKPLPDTSPLKRVVDTGRNVLEQMEKHPDTKGVIIAGMQGLSQDDAFWLPVGGLTEIDFRALEIGRKVLERAEASGFVVLNDAELLECTGAMNDGPVKDYSWLGFRCIPAKPVPLKGLAWLKSLPVGTRRWNAPGVEVFTVSKTGLSWDCGDFWNWNGVVIQSNGYTGERLWLEDGYSCWVEDACPETCPTWEPDA